MERKGERRKGRGKERVEGEKGMREEEGKRKGKERREGEWRNGKVGVQLPSVNRKKGFRLLSLM